MRLAKFISVSILFFSLISIFYSCKDSEVVGPVVTAPVFAKTFGGSLSDRAACVVQTPDGGTLVAGYTISSGAGGNDGFALKLDNNGAVQWYRVFGGTADDQINSVFTVTDGGFILVGETVSFMSAFSDIYAVKLDMAGNLSWSKYYKLSGTEFGSSVVQTADYGFLICGSTDGYGAGNNDAIVIKTDFDGNILWVNTYGQALNDYGVSIRAFDDNSSIMAGYTFSGMGGTGDISLIRLFANGNAAWTKYYGGSGLDQPSDLRIASDNGYIVSGTTYSFGLVSGDAYIFKTDGNGFVYWSRSFGGTGLDRSFSVRQAADGKFIAAGVTASFGSGMDDVFLLKLFGDGVFELAKTFGSSSNDAGTSIAPRGGSGFVLAGFTESYGAGGNDIYVVTLKDDGNSCTGNDVTPAGGDPVTLVNDAVISVLPLGTYETVEAGTTITSAAPSENTLCSE